MMRDCLRSAFVIARRDFIATVLSQTFLFFLLGPLFPVLLGGVFGAHRRARSRAQAERPVVAVVASRRPSSRSSPRPRQRLAPMRSMRSDRRARICRARSRRPARQRKRLLAQRKPPVLAVLDRRARRRRASPATSAPTAIRPSGQLQLT